MISFMKIFVSIIFISVIAFTQLVAGNGTYDFLRNDVSARAAALGGGMMTMTDDPATIFYNPAGLGTLNGTRMSFGFFKHLLDINSGYASYGAQISNLGYVGAGVQYVNYGDFNGVGTEGQDLGMFSANEFAITIGYAGELEGGLHYGANMKFIHSSIAGYSSSGAAVDLGVQFIAVRDRLLLGASLSNLGTQFNPYINTKEDLPLDLTVGASIYPEHLPAVLTINFHHLNDREDKFTDHLKAFSVGAELSPAPNLQLRVGYNNERRQELKIGSSSGFTGLSVGGGVSAGSYIIDYSYTSYGSIGAMHRVSVTF